LAEKRRNNLTTLARFQRGCSYTSLEIRWIVYNDPFKNTYSV
jgi:hypothetical protein